MISSIVLILASYSIVLLVMIGAFFYEERDRS